MFLKNFQSSRKAESNFGRFNFFMLLEWAFLAKSFHSAFIKYKFRFLFNSLLDSVVDFICHWLISIPNLYNKKLKGFSLAFSFWVCRWEGKFLEAIQVSPLLLCCSFPATTNFSFLISNLTMFTPFYFYTCHRCIIPTNVSFLISVLTMFTPFYFYFLKHKENIFFFPFY